MQCWKCGTEIENTSGSIKVTARDSCPNCDSDLHVCKNCRFYDPHFHNECREIQAEWVRDKEKANYCDYFEPQRTPTASGRSRSVASEAKAAFDKLFKN